ncbi:MAG: TSUP family transporter [Thermodesulfobacteriota bacterium]
MTRFCAIHWKTPAVALGVLCLATFAWAIHLWRDGSGNALLPVEKVFPQAVGKNVAAAAASAPVWRPGQAVAAVIAGGQAGSPTGSGVFVHPDGYLVTALHLAADRQDIGVRLAGPGGSRTLRAEVVKVAPTHDLVMLKVLSREQFPYAALGNSRTLRVGQEVFALGVDARSTVAAQSGRIGRLSCKLALAAATMDSLLATDAPLDVFLAGGPLVDENGWMVGMNIVALDPAGQPRGYAVPAHVLMAHFQEVIDWAALAASNPQPGAALAPAAALALPAAAAVAAVSDRLGAIMVGLTDHMTGQAILGFPLATAAGLLLLGFVSGLAGGMMTMGGGLIKVTGLMLLHGYGILLIRPVAYLSNIFIYGAAALRYRRDHLLDLARIRPFVPWAIAGVVLGYFAGTLMSDTVIRYLLAGFAILVGIKVAAETLQGNPEEPAPETMEADLEEPYHRRPSGPTAAHGLLGLPMGLISGILGITGGVIEVPLQNYVAGIPLRRAIANCAVLVFCTSTVAAGLSLAHGVTAGHFALATPLALTALLLPGAFAGGMFGAWLTKVIPFVALRGLYALLMFAMAFRMLYEG